MAGMGITADAEVSAGFRAMNILIPMRLKRSYDV
jgi:hypothetical protein